MSAVDRSDSRVGLLNGVCPYFTMFPLSFPLRVLKKAGAEASVFDPFCGRGTTLYAARLLGLESYGMDASEVAVAISQGKLANTTADEIVAELEQMLASTRRTRVPTGEFWEGAYAPKVLREICKVRDEFIECCNAPSRKALRAILLGALHGPLGKKTQSYLSNQMPRTYAPKPGYASRYWKTRSMKPPEASLRTVVAARAKRYFHEAERDGTGLAMHGDSRDDTAVATCVTDRKVQWIITSPPYYGMRTYVPDQWLRNWFVGGPPEVVYNIENQIQHTGQDAFSEELRKVWKNCRSIAADDCRLVIRFGGINDRKSDPRQLVKKSLQDSGWRAITARNAGTARSGKRQSASFGVVDRAPVMEYDIWCTLAG